MSFILDALRKSEIERQRQTGPSMAEFPVARTDRRLPVALLAIGFLLAVNLAVVLFFMLRDSRAPEAAAPAASIAASTAPAGAPAAVAPAPTTGNAPEILLTPGDEFAIAPVQTFDGLATEPPDAPDPTLIPDAPLSHPGVTYSEALPGPPESLPGRKRRRPAGAQYRSAYLCGRSGQARRLHQWPPLRAGCPYPRRARGRGDHARRRRAQLPRDDGFQLPRL